MIAKDVYHLHASGMAPSELIYGCFNIDCYVSMDMKKCQSRQPGCRHGSSEGCFDSLEAAERPLCRAGSAWQSSLFSSEPLSLLESSYLSSSEVHSLLLEWEAGLVGLVGSEIGVEVVTEVVVREWVGTEWELRVTGLGADELLLLTEPRFYSRLCYHTKLHVDCSLYTYLLTMVWSTLLLTLQLLKYHTLRSY